MKYFFITSLVLLLLAMLYTKEGFIGSDCTKLTSCKTCADTSGCSWCPKKNICIYSKNLKSTDECNQMNVINSSFSCDVKNKLTPALDAIIYKNEIGNKIPPANVYTTGKVQYTNEDVISTLDNMKNDNKNLRFEVQGLRSNLGNSTKSPPL